MTRRADPRTERAHAATLAAATGLLLEGGFGAVTIDAVSAKAGVAKTTIYRRWANRGELLVDVLRQFSLDLEPPAADLDPRERVRLVARQMAAALRTPEWQRVLPIVVGATAYREELAPHHDKIDAHRARVLSTVLRDAVAAGALPPDTDLGEVFFQLFGPLVTAAMMRPEVLDDAFADRMVDLLFASRRAQGILRPRSD